MRSAQTMPGIRRVPWSLAVLLILPLLGLAGLLARPELDLATGVRPARLVRPVQTPAEVRRIGGPAVS